MSADTSTAKSANQTANAGANGSANDVLLRVDDLKMHFPIRRGILQRQVGAVKAIDGVTFEVHKGETLGLVGESGCGKSTTGRVILQLYKPTSGRVFFEGEDLTGLRGEDLRRMRRRMQMIFQDPYASLNPRMTVAETVGEPLDVHGVATGKERDDQVQNLLKIVGLNPQFSKRYPHEFSGGQRQSNPDGNGGLHDRQHIPRPCEVWEDPGEWAHTVRRDLAHHGWHPFLKARARTAPTLLGHKA